MNDYSRIEASHIWWLKSQISYWGNRKMFDQFVTEAEIQENISAIKARIAELEGKS